MNAHENFPEQPEQDVATALVDHHRAFMGFLSKRLGNVDDAEDVLQDFCIKAVSRQNQLHNQQSMVAWLYSLLRSTLADHYRKTGRQRKIIEAYQDELKVTAPPAKTDDLYDNFCHCLHALLPALRPDQAKLLKRLDIKNGDRKSIAEELKISPGTLSVRLHRARQALRKALMASCQSCLTHGFDDCAAQNATGQP
jgi:RNA polymerase sigma factor (sigma-70 family)